MYYQLKNNQYIINMNFKDKHNLDDRKDESLRIRKKYPDRIPVIIENYPHSTLKILDKTKFLVPTDLTIGQLAYVIRKRIKLKPTESLFLFMGTKNIVAPTCANIYSMYMENQDEDGFLYIMICEQATFGQLLL
jgi:GABA(A) receptor-associated protein